jgi:hypothetical protein
VTQKIGLFSTANHTSRRTVNSSKTFRMPGLLPIGVQRFIYQRPSFSKLTSSQKDEGCTSLKVNLNEEKPKAAGLVVSGVVNVQCGHTLISTITDLGKGEE